MTSKSAAAGRNAVRVRAVRASATKPQASNGTKLHIAPALSASALRHDLAISPRELTEARRALAAVHAQ